MTQTHQPFFARRGYYLHACWEFNYPFSVRSWKRADYQGMFELLRALGMNVVMLWPTTESAPPPLSDADASDLRAFRQTIDDARGAGLETWLTQAANITSRPAIARLPFFERHLYPFMESVRLDDPVARDVYLAHRREIVSILNNADAYVTIDGDPGGYLGTAPAEFLRVLRADQETLRAVGTHPDRQRVIPWIWCGWGSDWNANGPWNEPLEPLTMPVLELLKREMNEPWELLPGRSAEEHVSNGRVNIEMAECAGLIDRSLLMLYEIIEYEPSQPATWIQFDLIRDVLKREMKHAGTARGVIGNAQQPIMSLPNLFFFARATRDLNYLEKSDVEVFTDFAAELGGPAEILGLAWRSLRLSLDQLPADLPMRLRDASLKSDIARHIPGGAQRYLHILAQMVHTRRCALQAERSSPSTAPEAATVLADAIDAIVAWWKTNGYVFSGEKGHAFQWAFVHPAFVAPVKNFAAKYVRGRREVIDLAAKYLVERGTLSAEEAVSRVAEIASS